MRKVTHVLLTRLTEFLARKSAQCAVGYSRIVIDFCILRNYLDRQWYLDFKDTLNKLSLDEDRPDTV